ncbi:DUF2637 domain-containing protein [Streptomyces hydrogenans]|uniref:DUF2637 domain-containing protein n=1 Tax=Streptomyces hydrogenans TaxID=1873719 RepID=UPI0033CC3D47
MTTTVEPIHRVPAPADTTERTASSGTRTAPSPTQASASGTFEDTPDAAPVTDPKTTERASTALMWACLILAPFIAFVGFYLSFHNLTAAAQNRFGFPTIGQARLFALGVDGAIVLFLAGDLFFVSRGRRTYWMLRPAAHLMTAATIWFNATAHGSLAQHWDKAIPHAAMPILFVVTIEAARHYLIQAAALEMGLGRTGAPLARWILAPRMTWAMWSRMKQWSYTYEEAMALEQKRAIYGVWLQHREELEAGHEEGMVNALDRLPMTMKRFGLSVEDALALPDTMRREAQERQQKAEVAKLHLALAKEKADAEAEIERLKVQGDIDRVRASVKAGTGVAEAEGEAAEATARLQAATTLQAAERAATAAQRQADAEEAAEESARIATAEAQKKAALAKVAEDQARVLEAQRKQTEESSKLAIAKAQEKAALAKVAEDEARVLEGQRKVAEENARIEQARHAAAQTALRAAEAEALASLSARELRVRVVARLLIDSMPIETVRSLAPQDLAGRLQNLSITNAEIAQAIGGVSEPTASSHKTAAIELIARGYNHHTPYDPDTATKQ